MQLIIKAHITRMLNKKKGACEVVNVTAMILSEPRNNNIGEYPVEYGEVHL